MQDIMDVSLVFTTHTVQFLIECMGPRWRPHGGGGGGITMDICALEDHPRPSTKSIIYQQEAWRGGENINFWEGGGRICPPSSPR